MTSVSTPCFKIKSMKVRTKKGIVDTAKSIDKLNDSIKGLGNAANKATKAVKGLNLAFYLNWKAGFKPQSQVLTWILPTLAILFGLAVIAWYVLVRF